LAVCARRFHLKHLFHLQERPLLSAPGRGEDGAGALPLGTLAAELLDGLGASAAAERPSDRIEQTLEAELLLRGQDTRSLAMSELITRLARFLQCRYLLQEPEALRRGARLLVARPYVAELAEEAPRLT